MRSRCDSTFASEHMSRCVTSIFDISSVNSATGMFWRTARLAAMQSPNADLPMLGRAATTIRFPGWKPEVSLSSSRYPEAMPVTSAPASYSAVIRSKLSFSRSSMWVNSPATRSWERSKTTDSALSTSSSAARPSRSIPRRAISCPARTRPRSVAISRTIFA